MSRAIDSPHAVSSTATSPPNVTGNAGGTRRPPRNDSTRGNRRPHGRRSPRVRTDPATAKPASVSSMTSVVFPGFAALIRSRYFGGTPTGMPAAQATRVRA